jgi:protein-L-isoaspartate(D-aspartate) O-methyltransferase
LNTYQDTYKHKGLRLQLVELLKQKGIVDFLVLDAVSKLPRHFFLPHEFDSHAYEDKAFPIGEDQTISQPYTVAYQSQLLQLKSNDKVLEIGTGSGYQGSILSLCGAQVYSIERHAKLSASAASTIKKVNAIGLNIQMNMFVGDGTKGLAEHGPYNKIIVTAGAPSVPKALVKQLSIGGLLVIPVGGEKDMQRMVRITKVDATNIKTEVFEQFSFVPLLGENGWK